MSIRILSYQEDDKLTSPLTKSNTTVTQLLIGQLPAYPSDINET